VVGLSEVLVVVDDEVCIGIMVAINKLVLTFMIFTFPIYLFSHCGVQQLWYDKYDLVLRVSHEKIKVTTIYE
jgi:hypothetical protein